MEHLLRGASREARRRCAAPNCFSAVTLDRLTWANMEEGIVGIGPDVAAALRAFDAQYLTAVRSPNETISPPIKPRAILRSQICAGCPVLKRGRRRRTGS